MNTSCSTLLVIGAVVQAFDCRFAPCEVELAPPRGPAKARSRALLLSPRPIAAT